MLLPHAPGRKLRRGVKRITEPRLFDLATDATERNDLAAKNPAVVKRMFTAASRAKTELGDGERKGANVRTVGRAKNPTARVK
jgi:hypothetical protein